jgi:hypothetical protein
MFRQLALTAALVVSVQARAQGVYPYPTKAEVSRTLNEASDLLTQFDEVTVHLDIDSWNAPEAFRGRQKLLLSDAQEGLNDVRDDIESELEDVNSGKQSSANDLLIICTKVSQVAHFVENVSVYSSVFQDNATYRESVSLSELAGSAKMASIHCGGILTVQVAADEIRVKSCHHPTSR